MLSSFFRFLCRHHHELGLRCLVPGWLRLPAYSPVPFRGRELLCHPPQLRMKPEKAESRLSHVALHLQREISINDSLVDEKALLILCSFGYTLSSLELRHGSRLSHPGLDSEGLSSVFHSSCPVYTPFSSTQGSSSSASSPALVISRFGTKLQGPGQTRTGPGGRWWRLGQGKGGGGATRVVSGRPGKVRPHALLMMG